MQGPGLLMPGRRWGKEMAGIGRFRMPRRGRGYAIGKARPTTVPARGGPPSRMLAAEPGIPTSPGPWSAPDVGVGAGRDTDRSAPGRRATDRSGQGALPAEVVAKLPLAAIRGDIHANPGAAVEAAPAGVGDRLVNP